MALWAMMATVCPADMIVTQDGTTQVGLVKSEDEKMLLLRTGTAASANEVVIPRERLQARYRGKDELQKIRECPDAALLESWTAAYFWAGLEDLAERCLQRATDLSPALTLEPRTTGGAEYRLFWNRSTLQRRLDTMLTSDSASLLRAAKWAKKAELAEEAESLLRTAYDVDRSSAEILEQAREWGVRLDPWIRLDLRPALTTNLKAEAIQDEGLDVQAQKDMDFILLPLHYDPTAGPRNLTRNSLRSPDLRNFYGLRIVRFIAGQLQFQAGQEPIYERIDLLKRTVRLETPEGSPGATTAPVEKIIDEIVATNSTGPRHIEGDQVVRLESEVHLRSMPPTDWVAAIYEIPRNTKFLTFQWMDGISEDLDLEFIHLTRKPLSEILTEAEQAKLPLDRPPPPVATMITKLTEPSASIATLAIHRLALLREEAGDTLPPWITQVDTAIIPAGARADEDIRLAAWDYLTRLKSVPEPVLDGLARQSIHAQRNWIELIRRAVGRNASDVLSPARRSFAPARMHRTDAQDTAVAIELLGAVLRSNSESVCNAALDLLMDWGNHVDWGMAEKASETSQYLTLSRLEQLTDRQASEKLLRAMMKDVRPSTAAGIATHARRLGLRIEAPDDPLLLQWSRKKLPESRLALLTVLQAVDLDDLLYSRPVAEIVQTVVDKETDGAIREAGLTMLVEQAERRRRRRITDRLPPAAGQIAAATEALGEFPVLLSIKTQDPVIQGLAEAARRAAQPLRLRALSLVLLSGYGEEAAACIAETTVPGPERENLLRELADKHSESACCDGTLAMLGFLLRQNSTDNAEYLLITLLNLAADPRRPERWRYLAALKTGVDFKEWSNLATALPPVASGTLVRLLSELGHMSRQDQQKYAAARDTAEKLDTLLRIDQRRGYLVDGRYAALAVVESTVAEKVELSPTFYSLTNFPNYRWRVPEHWTITLPVVLLETNEKSDECLIRWEKQIIGQGRAKMEEGYREWSARSKRLDNPPDELLGAKGWGWLDPERPDQALQVAVGPVILPERIEPNKLPQGTLKIEAGDWLRAALRETRSWADDDVDKFVPSSFKITLRYGAFGSFQGSGKRQSFPLPGKARPGQRHLLNAMIILEKLEP